MGSWFSKKQTVKNSLKKVDKSYSEYQEAESSGDSKKLKSALEEVVRQYGQACALARAKHHKHYASIAINYGAMLDEYKRTTGKNAEHTTIEILLAAQKTFAGQEERPKEYPTLLNNLANAYVDKYLETNEQQSLIDATKFFNEASTSLGGGTPSPQDSDPQYSGSLLGIATVICLQCEHPERPSQPRDMDDLRRAIGMLTKVLDKHRDIFELQCLRQLANAHDICYRRTRTTIDDAITTAPSGLDDLANAIKYNTEALQIDSNGIDAATCFINLAKQEFERHLKTRNSDGVDLAQAEKHLQRAEKIVSDLTLDSMGLGAMCKELRTNMRKDSMRQETTDYNQSRPAPARQSSTRSPSDTIPRSTGQFPDPILETPLTADPAQI